MTSPKNSVASESREIIDNIRRLVQSIRMASRDSEKKVGLSAAQLFVMQRLGEENELSVNDLADRTLTHQSSVSVIVQKLADQKLVMRVRSKNDGRQLKVSLTRKGKALLKKAPHAVQDALLEGLKKMPTKSRKELARSLSVFVEESGLGQHAAPLLFDEPRIKKRRKKE